MKQLNKSYTYSFLFVFFTLLLANSAYSQVGKNQTAPFTLYGKVLQDEKPVENVTLEILKNGKVLKKIVTTKNGKYSFSMDQDTVNKKSEYTINIIKEGIVPKKVVVNTYVPKEEYDDIPYEYLLEITLLARSANDIVIRRPSARIKWIDEDEGFGIDKVYAKIVQKEEEELKEDPDKYLKEIAKKAKEEEELKQKQKEKEEAEKQRKEELARKEEEEKNRLKAEALKQETEVKLKENIKAITTEMKSLTKQRDTVIKKPEQVNSQSQPKEAVKSLPVIVSDKNEVYDNTKQYELKKDRIKLIKAKEEAEKKKNANLAAKYETNNSMSSLLDVVDEHNKRTKNK